MQVYIYTSQAESCTVSYSGRLVMDTGTGGTLPVNERVTYTYVNKTLHNLCFLYICVYRNDRILALFGYAISAIYHL